MKTRDEIYAHEAADLLRDITMYHCMAYAQILKLYPGKDEKINLLLQHLMRQGRIFHSNEDDCFYDRADGKPNQEMLSALWVLADFADRAAYHLAGEFPQQLTFFADGEMYDVIYISIEKQPLIEYALAQADKEASPGKRIVIVESSKQIFNARICNTAAFCVVNPDTGKTTYFQPIKEA